jgi:hypothetical protein
MGLSFKLSVTTECNQPSTYNTHTSTALDFKHHGGQKPSRSVAFQRVQPIGYRRRRLWFHGTLQQHVSLGITAD